MFWKQFHHSTVFSEETHLQQILYHLYYGHIMSKSKKQVKRQLDTDIREEDANFQGTATKYVKLEFEDDTQDVTPVRLLCKSQIVYFPVLREVFHFSYRAA